MRLLSVAAAFSACLASTLASPNGFFDAPQHNDTEIREFLQKRQSGNVVVSGVRGTAYPRLEIRNMQQTQPNQFTLLILGLEYFQGISQSDDTGYWGISRIHGVPHQSWNGVNGPCSSCYLNPGQPADGYCNHNIITFPCWHRAYMALFEQQFMGVVQGLAAYWPGSNGAAMRQAAATFRFPYFDWAQNPGSGPALPTSISSSQITVNAQNGPRTLANPLFSYQISDNSQLFYSPFTTWPQTLRWPNSNNANAQSQTQSVINAFNANWKSWRDQVYTLLTGCSSYFQFSNDVSNGQGACVNSLEQIHNNIHNTAGGPGSQTVSQGHMAILAEAAFDPIFWLHHCNVDRLFALWQALHSDYSASEQTYGPTWVTPAGTNTDMNSGLPPFRQNANSFHTCNTVKSVQSLGYTYPELQGGSVSAAVNKLYGPNSNAPSPGPSSTTKAPAPAASTTAASKHRRQASLVASNSTLPTALPSALRSPTVAQNGSLFQYFANIATPRFTLNGSYNVLLFDAAPANPDPTTWLFDPNLIGTMGVFSQSGRTSNPLIIYGQVPLTTWATEIQQAGQIKDLTEASMVPYLEKNLRVKVVGPHAMEIDPATVQGLEVKVVSSTLNTAAAPVVNALGSQSGGGSSQPFSSFTELGSVDPKAASSGGSSGNKMM